MTQARVVDGAARRDVSLARATTTAAKTPGAAAAPAHRGREKGRLKREEILAVAARLFARTGFRGTGIAKLAAEAGVTVPGLLHHFGSKEGLLMAVLERRDAEDVPWVSDVVEAGGIALVHRLPEVVDHVLDTPGISRLTLVLLGENVEADAPGHEYLVRRYRRLRAAIARGIRIGMDRGEIRTDADPDAAALEISVFVDGVIAQWLLDPDRVDLRASFQAFAARLARDLAAGPAAG